MRSSGVRRNRGVTLIETLVAVSVIALLAGVLVPTLSGFRATSRESACMTQQRRLHVATIAWAVDHQNQLPGINTSNKRWILPGSPPPELELLGDTSPSTPTSVFDWISPILGVEHGLSSNRAMRTRQIFEDLGCPETWREADAVWGLSSGDRDDFELLRLADGFRQTSYLSPAAFHLTGKPVTSAEWAQPTRQYRWAGPAVTPRRYRPSLDRIGAQHAIKIWVADGTRYLARRDLLDFDIHPKPQYFGSFTTSGPIYVASRAYGNAQSQYEFAGEAHSTGEVYPHNRNLSYRHRGRIMTTYFDGHAGRLDEAASKTDATPWYPGGSEFTGVRATPESLSFHEIGEELP